MFAKGGGKRATEAFFRGFIATGLLVALQERQAGGHGATSKKRILRLSLQGGAALSAATVSAEAIYRRDYLAAAIAALAGAAGIVAADRLTNLIKEEKEAFDGEEQA